MRLQTFLLTEGRTKKISKEDAAELLLTKHKDSVSGSLIYRGISGFQSSYGYINPLQGKPRRSQGTAPNFYTLIMSHSPQWSSWPSREFSLICSTVYSGAEHYGDVYNVFPENGATLAIAPDADIWLSFRRKRYGHLKILNDAIQILLRDLGGSGDADLDIQYFKKACKNFDVRFKNNKDSLIKAITKYRTWFEYGAIGYITDNYEGDLFKLLNNMISPKNDNFTKVKVGSSLPHDREVWTDAKCLVIYHSDYPLQ